MVARMPPDAQADFDRWARAGRVRPQRPRPIVQLRVPVETRRGTPVVVEWNCRAAARATLTIESPGEGQRVLSPGRVRGAIVLDQLSAGRHLIILRAMPHRQLGPTAVATVTRAVVEVIVPPPEIRLLAPAEGEIGRELVFHWEVEHADQAWLGIDGETQMVALRGRHALRPAVARPVDILVACIGEGGRGEARRQIEILMPRLSIEAPQYVDALLGGKAAISYTILGAVPGSTRLIALARIGEDQPIPERGTIEIDEVVADETLRLIATGYDDRAVEHDLQLRATLATVEIDEELEFLASRRI